jgi:Na+/proline symporter
MLGFNLDMLIFGLFLLINLAIGLFSSRRVTTLRDYAIGRKDFSTATLTATIVVSWIGGMYVFEILEHTYRDGLYFVIVICSACLCLWLVGLLAVRMREFLKNLSVAEAMGDLYGKIVQIITATSGVLSVLVAVAIEFKVISKVISLIFATESVWVPVIASIVVIIYSVSGGIRAITFTDVVQFFTFGTFIPILALVIWNQLKDPHQVIILLTTHPNFSWSQVIGWHPKFIDTLFMLLWFMLPAMDPVIFQRISMARDVDQVKRSFSYAALISLVVCLFLSWVAILLLANNPNLEPNKLFEYIIHTYTSAGLRGFIGIGVLALAMSTADSYLNASAVLLTNDIIKPLGIKLEKEKEVFVARSLCLVSGLFALVIALQFKGILALLQFANSLYMPVVTVPLLMAILGFRSSTMSILIGMEMGFCTVIAWPLIFKGADSIIPGIVANLLGLLGSHYLLKQKGGWVGVKDPYPLLAARQARQNAWRYFVQTIKQTPIYDYLQKNLPTKESTYPLMGMYILISTYLSFYFFKDHLIAQYPRIQYTIFHSVLLIVAILITYPIWNENFKSKKLYISIGWYLSILYVFFFLAALLTLVSGLQQEFIFLLVGNLIVASILLPFPVFLAMFILALPISWITFKSITSITSLPTGFNFWQFKLIYTWIVLGTSISVIFNIRKNYARVKVKFKQTYLEKLEVELSTRLLIALQEKNEEYETDVNNKTKNYLDKIEKAVAELKQELEQLYGLELNTSSNEQIAYGQLCSMIDKLTHTIRDISDKLSLSLTKLSPIELIDESIAAYRALEENYDDVKIMLQCLTTFRKTECDVEKIKLLLSNTLVRAQLYNPTKKPIILKLENTMIVYRIHHPFVRVMREQAIKITISTFDRRIQERDYYIARPNKEVASTVRGASEPMLLQNLRILDSHYGYMGLELVTPTDYQQFYVLPIKVNRLTRSKLLRNHWISF